MQIPQPIIHLGPLPLTFFGLIVTCAVMASAVVVGWCARRRGEDPVIVFDLLSWMLVLGVIAARLFYVVNPPPSVNSLYSREWYLAHLLDMQVGPLAVWSGGLSMPGLLVGAALGTLVVVRRHRLDGWLWADIAVPGLLVFLVVGPWSNLLMGQMIGPPTALPWGVAVQYPPPPYNDVLIYPPGTHFHPTPAYLSLWALVMAGGLWAMSRYFGGSLRKGDVFVYACLAYAGGLFFADFLRVDVNRFLVGLSGMQIVALVITVWAAAVMLHRRPAPSTA